MIRFTIPGHLCTNHRPRFGTPRGQLRIRKNDDYDVFLKKARVFAIQAANQNEWQVPPARVRVKVFIHAYRRRRADADNIMKPVLDSLAGVFFENDLYAVPMLFADKDDWQSSTKTDELTEVGIELLDAVGIQQILLAECEETF